MVDSWTSPFLWSFCSIVIRTSPLISETEEKSIVMARSGGESLFIKMLTRFYRKSSAKSEGLNHRGTGTQRTKAVKRYKALQFFVAGSDRLDQCVPQRFA